MCGGVNFQIFHTTKGVQKMHAVLLSCYGDHYPTNFRWFPPFASEGDYAILATARVRRETLREARFFGIVLPAAFIILLSALRTATTAAALSPDAMAFIAFLFSVLTALRRAVFTAFFFAVTNTLFLDDLWFATLFSFYLFTFSDIL